MHHHRSSPAHRVIGAAMVAALLCFPALAAVAAQPAAAGKPLPNHSTDMTLVATHPWAAAQKTTAGRQLAELQLHDGRIWAGYGDYAANTGPIVLASWDPQTDDGFEAAITVDTEAILNMREVDGELVAPATDPRSHADFAISGPLRQARPLGATHVFDTAGVDNDLWMVGSKGTDAVAWRSSDDGATWVESLRVGPTSGILGDFQRFYFAAVLDGRLYVQAVSDSGGAAQTSLVHENNTWSEGPDLLPLGLGWSPEVVGDAVIYQSSGQGRGSTVLSFDGISTTEHGSAFDVEASGQHAWMLDTTGRVLRSADLKRWEMVAQGPADGRSLAVSETAIYVGTASAQLWSFDLSAVESAKAGKAITPRCPPGRAKRSIC